MHSTSRYEGPEIAPVSSPHKLCHGARSSLLRDTLSWAARLFPRLCSGDPQPRRDVCFGEKSLTSSEHLQPPALPPWGRGTIPAPE